jgi:hypothetical protein
MLYSVFYDFKNPFELSPFGGTGTEAQGFSLEPHLRSILLWFIWRWSLENYLPGLALNCDPPDLSLPSS